MESVIFGLSKVGEVKLGFAVVYEGLDFCFSNHDVLPGIMKWWVRNPTLILNCPSNAFDLNFQNLLLDLIPSRKHINIPLNKLL